MEPYVFQGSALPLSYSPVTDAATLWLRTVEVSTLTFSLMDAFFFFQFCSLHLNTATPMSNCPSQILPTKTSPYPYLCFVYFFVLLKQVQVSGE